ncbi:MAG: hypothetical protein V4544_03390 [Pseudomonadota bacterium]
MNFLSKLLRVLVCAITMVSASERDLENNLARMMTVSIDSTGKDEKKFDSAQNVDIQNNKINKDNFVHSKSIDQVSLIHTKENSCCSSFCFENNIRNKRIFLKFTAAVLWAGGAGLIWSASEDDNANYLYSVYMGTGCVFGLTGFVSLASSYCLSDSFLERHWCKDK